MSFQPVLPFNGYAGWRFLQRTLPAQQATFNDSAPIKRATDQFRERIATVRSADDLMADRQLLQVALGAFGLNDDIGNRFFIKKILTDGTTSPTALSSRLADKRYAAFSRAFGFGPDEVPRTGRSGFADKIIAQYEKKQFELAVGEQDNDMRQALNVSSSLGDIVAGNTSNNARWFSIMGDAPVRAVIETALGLPTSLARIDLDQQLENFKTRARSVFGTDQVGDLMNPDQQTKLVRLFLVRSEAAAAAQTSAGSIALTLLQNVSSAR